MGRVTQPGRGARRAATRPVASWAAWKSLQLLRAKYRLPPPSPAHAAKPAPPPPRRDSPPARGSSVAVAAPRARLRLPPHPRRRRSSTPRPTPFVGEPSSPAPPQSRPRDPADPGELSRRAHTSPSVTAFLVWPVPRRSLGLGGRRVARAGRRDAARPSPRGGPPADPAPPLSRPRLLFLLLTLDVAVAAPRARLRSSANPLPPPHRSPGQEIRPTMVSSLAARTPRRV
jgi:hypothetical protein